MARSPAHKFGQIVGDLLEMAIQPLLQQFADEYSLFLDKKGSRPLRRGSKVRWVDRNRNTHDLDFVLERGGTPTAQGVPVAFIETAWRRYTKHSRNKVQEIQGAIVPLAETYSESRPFMGAVLAGVFTEGALTQLRSLGFRILYFSYASVLHAFAEVGLDAAFDESTPDTEFESKVVAWEALSSIERRRVADTLLLLNSAEVAAFMGELEHTVTRQIEEIRILFLHGEAVSYLSIHDALRSIEKYDEVGSAEKAFVRFEIHVRYANGDRIEGQFVSKQAAERFLNNVR